MLQQKLLKRLQACLATLLCTTHLFSEEPSQPLPIGNFSVPTVTQIAPLLGFGQHLIGKHALLPQFSGAYIRGHKSSENDFIPNIVYGIRDDLSVTLGVPFTLDFDRITFIRQDLRICSSPSNMPTLIRLVKTMFYKDRSSPICNFPRDRAPKILLQAMAHSPTS